MHVYKFCQCKNGTHKINPNNDQSGKSAFTVDCNIKKVYTQSDEIKDVENKVVTVTKISTKINTENEMKKNTIWSIFGINSATSISNGQLMPIMCMFVTLVLTIFN